MTWTDIPWSPSQRMLRQFGGLCVLFFGGLACWHGLHHGNVHAVATYGFIAVVAGVMAVVFPKALRPIFVGWMVAAFPIGWLVSHVALAVLYYGLFTPIAMLFRWVGRDSLGLRARTNAATYWRVKPAAADAQSYFRQF